MDERTQPSHASAWDEASWERIVAEHQQAVFRLAYLLLGDAHEAEDAAQEAFLRAFSARARFDIQRPLRPWLLRIVANIAANRRRSFARAMFAFARLGRESPASTPDVAEASSEQWQAHELWQAVRRLGLKDQQVIYLRYFLDLPEAEMAQALKVAPGTVKSRLHRALARLRSIAELSSLLER